ncbi:MAG: sugar phosphate isomerase/epimerase [Planctomycetia bacterium]|nr:sugar phosphate isomerase/epimerase [Planctomycetia bacterium]
MTSPASIPRRDLLLQSAGALGLAAWGGVAVTEPSARAATAVESKRPADEPFGYCLNTSTIREKKIGIVAELEIAAKVGYHAVEPWMKQLEEYVSGGGSLKDLGKRIVDLGLTIESAIGFAQWIVDDDAARAAGLEAAKRDMAMLVEIGGKRLAAPPVGAQKIANMNLFVVAERYRKLLELGAQMGIVPELEVWGHSQTLGRLGEAVLVAIEAGHPQACLLPDIYHIFKGGSEFTGLKLLSGQAIHVFHVNDYPASPSRAEQTDADRVYPGDGVAPLKEIFRTLHTNGFRGYLSLELFNREYWKQDPELVAKTGLEKTRAVVRSAFA